MARAYSWAQDQPGRRLYYSAATTAVTVAVGAFVASVYLAGFLSEHLGPRLTRPGLGWVPRYGGLAHHFELLGYLIAAIFLASWAAAVLTWKLRYAAAHDQPSSPAGKPKTPA
jgi:high-affinity nickel-transport protein